MRTLQEIDLDTFHLASGSHDTFEQGACAMELAAHLAGEEHSDHPECVCPVIGAFVRLWNDSLPADKRNELLKPIIPRLINTRGSKAIEESRSLMAADWFVRVNTPAWLRLAGLTAHAYTLARLPEITSMSQVPALRGPIQAARKDAAAARDAARAAARAAAWRDARAATRDAARDAAWAAARDAARDAAWAAARDAAWDAAWAAARDAAWDAARAVAWDAAWDAAKDAAWAVAWDAAKDAAWAVAWDAAWDAAKDAARDKLAPTVSGLQGSALVLVNRMIDATEG